MPKARAACVGVWARFGGRAGAYVYALIYICTRAGRHQTTQLRYYTYPTFPPPPVPAPRHTRTGGGSDPVGPCGSLSVIRRRRVPRAESELRAASTPGTRPEPGAVPGAALRAVSTEGNRTKGGNRTKEGNRAIFRQPNDPELLRDSRHDPDGASGGTGRVALGFLLRAGRASSRPPYTTPESATGPESIPVVVAPELPAKQVEQAQQVAASLFPTVPSSRTR